MCLLGSPWSAFTLRLHYLNNADWLVKCQSAFLTTHWLCPNFMHRITFDVDGTFAKRAF